MGDTELAKIPAMVEKTPNKQQQNLLTLLCNIVALSNYHFSQKSDKISHFALSHSLLWRFSDFGPIFATSITKKALLKKI